MGRKTKLTRKLIDRIVDYVAKGHTMKDAAALSGVSERSIYNWLEIAKNSTSGRSLHAVFAVRMMQAKSEFIDVHLGRVVEASKADPRYSQWLLERKAPRDFGRVQVEHSGKIEHIQKQVQPPTEPKVIHPGDPEWEAPCQAL